jgi:hypothetical protein
VLEKPRGSDFNFNFKYYIFWVCVALVIQHAMRMRLILFSSEARLALPYFSTYSHNVTVYKMRVNEFLHNFCPTQFSF